jgi:hypothetical protein
VQAHSCEDWAEGFPLRESLVLGKEIKKQAFVGGTIHEVIIGKDGM